jgi:hypothetical protein
MVKLAREPKPPLRFIAGSIAVNAADIKLAAMQAESKQWRDVSVSTDGAY